MNFNVINMTVKLSVYNFQYYRPGMPDFPWSEHTIMGKIHTYIHTSNDHKLYPMAIK
jgi:hypothetical protein